MKKIWAKLRSLTTFSGSSAPSRALAVHLTNADVFAAPGGLERFVLESARFATNELGLRTLVFFPSREHPGQLDLLDDLKRQPPVSFETAKQMLKAATVRSFHVQHAMNWQPEMFTEFCSLGLERASASRVYIHDLHFLCSLKSSAERCPACRDSGAVLLSHEALEKLLSSFPELIAPSESTRKIFVAALPKLAAKVSVQPHLEVADQGAANQSSGSKPAIVFSGACGTNKGIHHYTELIELLGPRFRWVTVGIEDKFHGNPLVEHRHFNFHENIDMQSLLRSLQPAVAFQGSVVPETFSFTLHEMMEAGLPVLTTVESGNIADAVAKLGCGKVFSSFDAMKSELTVNGEQLVDVLIRGAHRYECGWNKAAWRRAYGA